MLGATKLYPAGDQAHDAINAMADSLRAAGGVFQANHPAYRVAKDAEFHACGSGGCADCRAIHWTYRFDVRPDTIEVWNPSVVRSDVSEPYWECWLDPRSSRSSTPAARSSSARRAMRAGCARSCSRELRCPSAAQPTSATRHRSGTGCRCSP
jgi:hypothetical protein